MTEYTALVLIQHVVVIVIAVGSWINNMTRLEAYAMVAPGAFHAAARLSAGLVKARPRWQRKDRPGWQVVGPSGG